MSTSGRAQVPKFSSFKPAVKRPVDAERQQEAPIKRRRSSSSGSERTHHHRRHKDRTGRHARPLDSPTLARAPIRYESPTDNHLYMIDKKGDPQNWTYQRLHKYAIPNYYRAGYGNVLGLANRIKIDRETTVEDKIYLIDTRRLPALSKERSLLKRPKLNHISELRIDSRLHDQSFDSTTDFISLRSVRPPTRHSVPSPERDAFLEIKALHNSRPSPAKPADEDLIYASSDSENGTPDLDAETRQRTIELSRRTRLEPASLEPWLDLIAHQERLLRPAKQAVVLADLSNSERRTLADLRLHIFEKASKCIPIHDKSARETLFHAMFQEASITWDLPKYLQRLRDAIRELPASFLLWTMYLSAAQTKPIGFRFEEGKAFFLESLQSMRAVCLASHTPLNEETQDMHLYILLRYTTYLREAGYSELSIGLWQGLFEFHLFRPELHPITDSGAAVQSFENFWESEVPRFGERNSQGWRNNVSRGAEPAEDISIVEQQDLSPRNPFRSFAISEEKLSCTLPFPGRTSEETVSGDPFHIIFFSDIKDVLEATPFQFSQQNLVDAFLCYLGLPARPSSTISSDHASRVQAWRSDPFLSSGLLKDISTGSSSTSQPSIPHFIPSTQTLFSESFFPRQSADDDRLYKAPDTISELSEKETPTTTGHMLLFARSSLASLVKEYPDDEALAEYFLAYECHYFPKEASRTARTTLKRRPTSLKLYNACAMVESNLGNPEKASHIWAGAIKMKDSFAPEAQQEAVLLWHSWIWSEMQRGELHAAMSRLLSYDGVFEQDPATCSHSTSATLRVKRALKEGFDHALSQRNAHLTSLNVECLALLAYLNNTAADPLSVAIREVHEYCTMIYRAMSKPSPDMTLELLHQAKSRMIAYHIQQRGLYKPAFVRSELEASINLFPNNTMFLWLYKENESRFRIDDRVRAVLKDSSIANRRSALIGFSFAVDQELSRFAGQASGSTAESVRATFARALLSNESPVRHCKALWARWLRFEEQAVQRLAAENLDLDKRVGKQAIKKWREVFLGGLHHLPWVKEWVIIGLRSFDSEQNFGWSKRDLKGLYNVLQERELRVRVEGLDDLLDDINDMQ